MDIKDINEEYKKNNSKANSDKMDKIRQAFNDVKNKIEILENDKSTAENNKRNAEIRGDSSEVAAKKSEIEAINKKLEAERNKAVKLEHLINMNKQKVEKCIEELSQNPEFKKHIDIVMRKRLIRRSEKALKENECLNNLRELIDLEPDCQNYISDMKTVKIKIMQLREEIKNLDPVADASEIAGKEAEIDNYNKEYSKNRNLVTKVAEKNNIEIDTSILKSFIEDNGFKVDKSTKKFNIVKTIDNKIKGNEKTVANNDFALSNLDDKDYETVINRYDENGNERPINESKVEIDDYSNYLPDTVEEKPKWYQFVKRFRNWVDKRRGANDNGDIASQTRSQYEKNIEPETNEFKDALKYEVVEEYAKRREKEILSKAKEDRKQENDGR